MRVLLADPPAYTPPYDHALAAALAEEGADVELVTSRFRFGPVPQPVGYRCRESFYPLSSRLRARAPRLALKAVEHPAGMARLALARPDVLHLQWSGAPELDAWLLRSRAPLVFTAHDLLPRRTAHKDGVWQRLFARFDRVVAHSQRGRDTLAAFGVPDARLRVIPHPVFPSHPGRHDDGRTVLVLGVLRPYKGVDDALAATLSVDGARLLVAGDARIPLEALRARAGARAEWRLGYLGQAELSRALGEATVAVFPYRAELDQSGALLQALGAGVPAVVYDVGGLGEVVAAFDAGTVVPPGDVAGLGEALARLLGDGDALAAARAGAERARAELTWQAAARAHLDVYRELLPA
jgi:glycosyltransferase involved in cell wall biosynthesis